MNSCLCDGEFHQTKEHFEDRYVMLRMTVRWVAMYLHKYPSRQQWVEYWYLTAHAVVLRLAQARVYSAQQRGYCEEAVSASRLARLKSESRRNASTTVIESYYTRVPGLQHGSLPDEEV